MMTKTERFTMRLTPQDKQVFAELAARLHRTESDALRIIAREVVEAMKAEGGNDTAANQSPATDGR